MGTSSGLRSSFCSIGFQKNKWGADRVVEVPIERIAAVIAASGFDGLEVWHDHVRLLGEEELGNLGRQLAELKLGVPMLSGYLDFTTSDEVADKSVAEGAEALKLGARLGAKALRIFTGKVGSAEATAEQWDRAVKSLRKLAEAAEPLGMKLACETHARNLTDTIESSGRLVERIGKSNVGLILQPTTFKEQWRESVERLWRYAIHVHASNSKNGKSTFLQDGDVDWPWVLRTLSDREVNCFVSIEWMGPDPELVAKHEGPWLREQFQTG